MSAELNELAERVERADASEQGAMILLAFEAAFPKPPSDYRPRHEPCFSPEFSQWASADARVRNLVQYGAFVDAAMTLVPEGWRESYQRREDGTCISWCHPQVGIERTGQFGDAAAPALALTAAALRSKSASQ